MEEKFYYGWRSRKYFVLFMCHSSTSYKYCIDKVKPLTFKIILNSTLGLSVDFKEDIVVVVEPNIYFKKQSLLYLEKNQ